VESFQQQLKGLFDTAFEKGEDFGSVYEREKPQQISDPSALAKMIEESCFEPQAGGAISRGKKTGGGVLWPGDVRLSKGQAEPGVAE